MGLLPDTQNCRCACAGNAGNVFPVTAGKRSRHTSRHVRHARAVMYAGIANYWFPLKTAAGENFPGIAGACATCNFTYLVRGPWGHDDITTWKQLRIDGPLWWESIGHRWFPQRAVTQHFDFFVLAWKSCLNKQPSCMWFEMPWRVMWRNFNGINKFPQCFRDT